MITAQAHTHAVRMLTEFHGKSPELLNEAQLRDYLHYRKNVTGWSPKTMRICYCGFRLLYEKILARDWHILEVLRAQKAHPLPAVLSRDEVARLLGCLHTFHNRAFLATAMETTMVSLHLTPTGPSRTGTAPGTLHGSTSTCRSKRCPRSAGPSSGTK